MSSESIVSRRAVDREVQTGLDDEDDLVQISSTLKEVSLGKAKKLIVRFFLFSFYKELDHFNSSKDISWTLATRWSFAAIMMVSN